MEKFLKNGIFKSLLSTILFGTFYALISFVIEGFVEIDKVLISMFSYFLVACVLYFIAPKLRKITGYDKENK